MSWAVRFFVLVLSHSLGQGALADGYEPDIETFPASHTVPARWLQSTNYTVDPDVLNKDFMNHYRVDSAFGVFPARGNSRLFVRTREINALTELQNLSKGRLFVDSAGETVSSTVDNVNNAIDDPSGAAQEFGSGMSRLLKRLGRLGKNAYKKGRALIFDEGKKEERSEEFAGAGQDMAKGLLGVNRAYRELARELGVDPYTRNGLLRSEMERMANYAAAGSIGVKSIVPVLPLLYGAAYLITVSNLVWNTHPIDLQLQNEKALREMGMGKKLIARLRDSEQHTLTTQTRVTSSLQLMKGVAGRKVLMRYVSNAGSVNDALFFARMIELLAIYHQKRGGIAKIIATDRVPFALTRKGRAVVILPVDYLRWTRLADDLTSYLHDEMARYPAHLELWVTGQVSPAARIRLGDSGWAVLDHAGRRI